ncbi:hypothetical protein GCM10010989_21560 [Croceicoccus pelagius]|uniref:Uncharacterized protein n=1 Tax=Croceicoccus pelagius TaxID=1703341 RepID=A0A916YIX6_9SPHN|nr:hypothetical protein GCM10010989_21560 [Croceicoccus pelagius]
MDEFMACPLGKLAEVTSTRCGTSSGRGAGKNRLDSRTQDRAACHGQGDEACGRHLARCHEVTDGERRDESKHCDPAECRKIDHGRFEPGRPYRHGNIGRGAQGAQDVLVEGEGISLRDF